MNNNELRMEGWKPYASATDAEGNTVELISYPWLEGGVWRINARRTAGDPSTMQTFELEALKVA